MKTFVVLFDVDVPDAREMAELIENSHVKFDSDEQVNALNIFDELTKQLLKETELDRSLVKVQDISDFMDSFNDEELNPDNYFMSYVIAEVTLD